MNKKPNESRLELSKIETITNWQFRCMLTERGACTIKPWLLSISKKGEANLDRSLEQLKSLSQQFWHKPHPASKIGDNIYVIRFQDENRKQHRIFGHIHNKTDTSFVMTIDGYEKDNQYYPKNYETISSNNRNFCNKAHHQRTIECRYAKNACGEDVSDINKFHAECHNCRS